MSGATQEISTDYDHEANPPVYVCDPDPVIEDPLAGLDDVEAECQTMSRDLEQLFATTAAVEKYGMSPVAFDTSKRSGLLSGTAIECLGLEHFTHGGPDSPESRMALEALTDKLKEKAAAWAAKIVGFTKSAAEKILGVLGAIKDKVLNAGKVLIDKTWNAAKATKRTIKAHPYATVAAALTAAAVVVTIIGLAVAPGAYANESSLRSMVYKIQDAAGNIKWPLGKVSASVVESTAHLSCTIGEGGAGAAAETAAKLGWTQTAVKGIMGRFNQIWASLKTAISTMSAPIVNAAKKLNDLGEAIPEKAKEKVAEKTGSNLAGWAAKKWIDSLMTGALFSVIGVIVKLVRGIALKAFNMVAETFTSLKTETEATATA